ncbi:hypothetical protein COL95_21345 [Bacillus anthracis]|nr:hypothetical protein COL95_21345 [Bacillus anthracis]
MRKSKRLPFSYKFFCIIIYIGGVLIKLYSLLSLVFSLIGSILFIASVLYLPNLYLFISFPLVILGFMFSMVAISKNEASKLRFAGIFILLLLILFILIGIPFIFVGFGF